MPAERLQHRKKQTSLDNVLSGLSWPTSLLNHPGVLASVCAELNATQARETSTANMALTVEMLRLQQEASSSKDQLDFLRRELARFRKARSSPPAWHPFHKPHSSACRRHNSACRRHTGERKSLHKLECV